MQLSDLYDCEYFNIYIIYYKMVIENVISLLS